jgi:hypothetical protein
METPVRLMGCVVVAIMTVLGMRVFQHHANLPPDRALTGVVTITAVLVTWLVTGLE